MHAIIVSVAVVSLVVVLSILNKNISKNGSAKTVPTTAAIDSLTTDLLFNLDELRTKEVSVEEVEQRIFKIATIMKALESLTTRPQLMSTHNVDLDAVDGIILETKKMINAHRSGNGFKGLNSK